MHLDFQFLFKPELLWSTQFCLCPTTLFTPAAGPKKVRSASSASSALEKQKKSTLTKIKILVPCSSLPHQNYLAMSGADNPPVGRDHLEYLELQRAQAAAIAATADLNMSDMVATAAAASSPNYNSNDFTSTFSALPPRSAMNKLIMNYLVTGETT